MTFNPAQFHDAGYTIAEEVISEGQRLDLLTKLGAELKTRAGERDLLRFDFVQTLARSKAIRSLIDQLLTKDAFAVRAILFDKSPDQNWHVGWHQDLTIAVNHQLDVSGYADYGPWSSKRFGERMIAHVQPPEIILNQMATMRLHLDDALENNGALKVLPGSHQTIQKEKPDIKSVTCPVAAGSALFMKPMIWHSSAKSENPTHRRVLHIEYANCELAEKMDWYERV